MTLGWIRLIHMRSYMNKRGGFLRVSQNSPYMSHNTDFYTGEFSPGSRNFPSIFPEINHNSFRNLCKPRARNQQRSPPPSALLPLSVPETPFLRNVILTTRVISWNSNPKVYYQDARMSWYYLDLVNSEFLVLRIFNPENDSLIPLQAQLLIENVTLYHPSCSQPKTRHSLISNILPIRQFTDGF